MKKLIISVVIFIVILLASAGLWAYFAFLYTKPLSKAELAELTPDWSVVTNNNWSPWFDAPDGTKEWNPIASFNAWIDTIDESDLAWPMLVDTFYQHKELFDHEELGKVPSDVEDWDALVELLDREENQNAIELTIDALSRPVMGCAMYGSTDPIEHEAMIRYGLKDRWWDQRILSDTNIYVLSTPTRHKHLNAAKLLSTYALSQLEKGNSQTFINTLALLMDSTRLAHEFPKLSSALIDAQIKSTGHVALRWGIENHQDTFTDEQFQNIDQLLKRHLTMTIIWQGEAMALHNRLRSIASADGKLGASEISAWKKGTGVWMNGKSVLQDNELDASIQRLMYIFNKWLSQIDSMSKLQWNAKADATDEELEAMLRSLPMNVRGGIHILLPKIGSASEVARNYEDESNTLRLLIASHRHRIRHGMLPDSTDQIDKDLIP